MVVELVLELAGRREGVVCGGQALTVGALEPAREKILDQVQLFESPLYRFPVTEAAGRLRGLAVNQQRRHAVLGACASDGILKIPFGAGDGQPPRDGAPKPFL